jgi:ERCC4-type nuclease
VRLHYDHREERSGIPGLLADHGIDVAPGQLPVGDYILSDRMVVERKTGSDLAASIKSRRVFEQLERLTEAYTAVVLVVEGEPVHMSRQSWMGGLARVLAAGVAVVRTDDPEETAEWLLRLYRLEGKGAAEPRGRVRTRRARETVAEDVLGALPGVSTVGARRLLAHFGSLREVFAADEAALREVQGFGPVRAAQLAEVFGT